MEPGPGTKFTPVGTKHSFERGLMQLHQAQPCPHCHCLSLFTGLVEPKIDPSEEVEFGTPVRLLESEPTQISSPASSKAVGSL